MMRSTTPILICDAEDGSCGASVLDAYETGASYPVLCINPRCRTPEHGGPRRTSHAWFCDTCIARMAEQLGYGYTNARGEHVPGLAELWDDLEANLARAETPQSADHGRIRNGGKSHGTLVNERVSDAMRAATTHIWFTVRALLDWADANDTILRIPADQTTPILAAWIATWHVNVLATGVGRYTAQAIIEDTRTVWTECRRRAYPSGGHRVETGMTCTMPDCGGSMGAWITPTATTLPDLVCSTDPDHRVEPHVWQRDGWKRAANRDAHLNLARTITTTADPT